MAGLRWDFASRPPAISASEAGQHGRAVAVCTASAEGAVSDCRLLMAEPAGSAVGDLLLARGPMYRMNPRSQQCATIRDKVAIGLDVPSDGAGVTWLRRPKADDVSKVYPPQALRKGQGASYVLACETSDTGDLQQCRALFVEGAEDAGFDRAALALAKIFRLKPAVLDGKAVRDFVIIPLNFQPEPAIC